MGSIQFQQRNEKYLSVIVWFYFIKLSERVTLFIKSENNIVIYVKG